MTKISCIMPTANRRKFLPIALDCYKKQTWANKELVVVDDGEDNIYDLVEGMGDDVVYYRPVETDKRVTLGEKRNIACELATGEFICHWDDDDWSAPDRIETQGGVLASSGKQVFGYHTLLFYDFANKKVWNYKYPRPVNYGCGSSLCYTKEYWRNHRFPHIAVVEDNKFNGDAEKGGWITSTEGGKMMVATVHPKNSSIRNIASISCFIPVTLEELPEGVQDLWSQTL